MITDYKITEISCATDEFSKKFDEEIENMPLLGSEARLAAVGHNRGYYVVRITPEERKQRAVSMGYDARKQQLAAAPKDTDVTDVS